MYTLFRLIGLWLAIASWFIGPAHATPAIAWKPDRPVTIVVPFTAGGGTDAQMRPLAEELSKMWGQPVVIDNRPGADGSIGARKVIESKPDGYTLLVHIPNITLLKHVPAMKGFDPLPSLAPISAVAISSPGFIVNSKIPGKTLQEVLQYCKKAAPPCSFGSIENVTRLEVKQIIAENGLNNLILVNYKGSSQLMTDLVANNINMAIVGTTPALPHFRAGTLKILAIDGQRRVSALPDVPTGAETGFPYLSSVTWYGLFAPKGTPDEILDSIAAAVGQAVKRESVVKAFGNVGAEPIGSTREEFSEMVSSSEKTLGDLAKRFPLE